MKKNRIIALMLALLSTQQIIPISEIGSGQGAHPITYSQFRDACIAIPKPPRNPKGGIIIGAMVLAAYILDKKSQSFNKK